LGTRVWFFEGDEGRLQVPLKHEKNDPKRVGGGHNGALNGRRSAFWRSVTEIKKEGVGL